MKSTTKSTKSPTPATPASAPAAKAARVPRVKKSEAPAAPPAPAAAPPPPAASVITARIDVGFGNTLYIRGQGPGLSWNRGVPLTNAGEDVWTLSLPGAADAVTFKFLLNDETWSRGEDYSLAPGASGEFTPEF